MRAGTGAALLVCAALFAACARAADAPEEKTKAFGWAGLGSGTASYKINGNRISFGDEFQGAADESPFVAIKVVSFGVEVGRNLFAGVDLTGVAQSGTVGTDKVYRQISNYFLSLTWFPWERGLYLKGAAGVSSFFLSSGSQSDRVWGPGGLVSAGYALRITGPHHLTLAAEQGWQTYAGSSATRPESSQYTAAFLGYMWRP